MAKDALYHTTTPEYPKEVGEVHHDHNACYEGKKIKPEHRKPGDGGKRLCLVCAKMA